MLAATHQAFIDQQICVRYRILISDDEVDIVEMLTGFFRSKGYEVFSAYNGVETLKLAAMSFAVPHLAEPYSTPCRNCLAFFPVM